VENFDKVIIGLVLFAITSIVAYLFKMRQLYVSVPKLFRHASISKDGSLCELIIYNKGNQVEENIQVDFNPKLKGELLASSSSDITLEGSTIKIERLHKGGESSAILLIENGMLDPTEVVSVSSKGTKGAVVKNANYVPPNFAKLFLLIILYIGIFPAIFYGISLYERLHSEFVEDQLRGIYKLGWKNLSRYYDSDIHKSYSNHEFPIRFLSRKVDDTGKPTLTFEVYNKTALPMHVAVDKNGSHKGDISNFAFIDLQPMSKEPFSVVAQKPGGSYQPTELNFTLKCDDEYLYDLIYVLQEQ